MKTKDITFTAMMIALAVILELFCSTLPILHMPLGGHPTLSAIPLIILGYKKGLLYSLIGGLAVGFIQMSPYAIHPFQYILDYPLAFMCMGLGSIFLNIFKPNTRPKIYFYLVSGIILSMTLRFLSHFISGLLYFRGSGSIWTEIIASASYNFYYMFATTLLTIYLSIILFAKLLNMHYFQEEKTQA